MPSDYIILGAGVIGLTTALELRSRYPDSTITIIARFLPEADATGAPFTARLVRLDGDRVATGRDFDDLGQLKGSAVPLDEQRATALAAALGQSKATVLSVESKPYSRRPAAPFTTSTLAKAPVLGSTSKRTCRRSP